MKTYGTSLARAATVALSAMLPFAAGSTSNTNNQVASVEQEEREPTTQGFLIDFNDHFSLRNIKNRRSKSF